MTPLSPFTPHWSALSALLDEALGLPAPDRATWLDRLGGEQASHREALRALLAHQAAVETDDFLATLPKLDHANAHASAPFGAFVAAGQSVGAYRLIEEIAQGGMGTVWLAERADGQIKRRVALKLPRIMWGDAFAERLAREREILATLEHAHIARLYDAGVDAHGRPFLAMEYVDGEPIDAHCRARALSVRERIELLLQVMAAVGHAHSRLVIHRDLKPGNILVTRDGTVKLLDFGIAKLLEGDSTRRTALTELSGRAFTLDYASPEQIRGEPLGTASDVYSMAVVAYELLSGTRPYRLARAGAAQLEDAIATVEPPSASSNAPGSDTSRQLRGDLDAILNHALKKEAADRYAGIDAFAQDLQRHLRGEPVRARPDGMTYRIGRFVGRHRLAVAMGSTLLGAVIAGGALSTWQWRSARAEAHRASTELRRQRAIRDLYMETLSRLSVLASKQPEALARPGAVTSVLTDKLAEMAPRFANSPDERGAQLEATMLQLNYDNRFDDSLAVGKAYLDHMTKHGAPPALVIAAHGALGRTLFQLDRLDESEAMRRAGLDWAPDAHDQESDIAHLSIASDLGGILTARGKREEALAVLTRADETFARPHADEHQRFELLTKLANFHVGFDERAALKYMRQAQTEMVLNASADPQQRANMGWQLGSALLASGDTAEAESSLHDSMLVYRQEYGRDSRNAVRAFGRLVDAVSRRDPERAASMIDDERRTLSTSTDGVSRYADLQLRSRQIATAWLAGDSVSAIAVTLPDEATLLAPAALRENDSLLINLSRALMQSGRAPAALRVMRALQAGWPDRGLPSAAWIRIQETLGEAELQAAQPAAAAETAVEMIHMLDSQHASAGRAYRSVASIGALAAVRLGDRAEAARLLDRIAQTSPPFPSPVERADCELRRAEALIGLGRVREGATIVRDLLGDLGSQHRDSARLALAHRLIASGNTAAGP